MLKQQLQIKLSQKLSPQQIQLMKLIQLSTLDLEQRVQSELGENPALESGLEEEKSVEQSPEADYDDNTHIDGEDIDIDQYLSDDEIPSYRFYANNFSQDDEENLRPISSGISFHQFLQQQLGNLILNEEDMEIAAFLVGSIDESGYLRRNNEELIDDLAFTQNMIISEAQLEKVLKAVQSLDPPGVGARSLNECLLLQLQRKKKDRPEIEHALAIIEKEFYHFSHKHYDKLQERLNLSEQDLKEAIHLISKLNPKPGGV